MRISKEPQEVHLMILNPALAFSESREIVRLIPVPQKHKTTILIEIRSNSIYETWVGKSEHKRYISNHFSKFACKKK